MAGTVCVCEYEEADVKASIWNPFIPGSRGMEFGPKVTLSILCSAQPVTVPRLTPSCPISSCSGNKMTVQSVFSPQRESTYWTWQRPSEAGIVQSVCI